MDYDNNSDKAARIMKLASSCHALNFGTQVLTCVDIEGVYLYLSYKVDIEWHLCLNAEAELPVISLIP